MQRFSYVAADRGDCFRAYRLARRATRAYSFVGDRVGMGKAMVDQGIWLERLGWVADAVVALESALAHWLPKRGCQRSRMAAFHGLAVCHQKLGQPRAAAGYLEQALASGARLGSLEKAKLVWFQGTVARDAGEHEEAERFLEASLEMHRELSSPFGMALVSVDLVQVQVLRRDAAAAYSMARRMVEVMGALKRNRRASAAVAAIARCGLDSSGLSLALVERVRGQLEKAWAASKKKRRKNAAVRRRAKRAAR